MATDFMNQMFSAQKNMFDAWQNMVMPNRNNTQEKTANAGFMDFASWQDQAMKNFKEMNDWYAAMFTSSSGSPAEIFKKMNQSVEVFNNIGKVWESLNAKAFTPDIEGMQRVFEEWSAQYWKFIEDFYIANMPPPVQKTYRQYADVAESYQTVMKNFFSPWTESSNQFKDLAFNGSSFTHFESFLEMIKLWKENYDKSYSKLLNSPAMGLNRELLEKQYDSMDKAIKFVTSSMQFYGQVFKVSQNTMQKVITDYTEMLKEGTQPKTMEEFHKYWAKEIDKSFDNLYLTDDFSKLMSTVVDSTMELKKEADKLMEEYLALLPLPRKSDMDSLYKTIYTLKKEIKSLKKELEKINAQNKSGPAAANPSTTIK